MTKEIIIRAQCSQNYQVGDVSITLENPTEDEIYNGKAYVVELAKDVCLSLQENISQNKPVAHTNQFPPQQKQQNNFQPSRTIQPQGNQLPRMASEKQVNYLKSFGYNGPSNITFTEADQLLRQYKQQ